MGDTTRIEKVKAPDIQKFLEEVRALKNRLQSLELGRLEEGRQGALEASAKETARRAKGASPEEVLRLQQEARRYVDAEHENSKAILAAKYEKFEANLQVIARYLGDLAPLRDLEARLAQEGERLKKLEDELRVRRKVVEREEEELAREKELQGAAEAALLKRDAEVRAKLADLDVVRRAQELGQLKADLEGKLKAYEAEAAASVRQRDELNRDFDKLGEKRAELDREAERLNHEREGLREERAKMADTVAREFGLTFEAFVRDLLRPPPA